MFKEKKVLISDYEYIIVFGSLVVACLPLGPRFAGSNQAEVKNAYMDFHSYVPLHGEVLSKTPGTI
jgi:hypothetical protein